MEKKQERQRKEGVATLVSNITNLATNCPELGVRGWLEKMKVWRKQ